jgi:hypothetical protein
MPIACLDTLVGLSSTSPKCFTDAEPEDYNVSDSGYYVNDADYGIPVIESCQMAGWTLLSESLEIAKRDFQTDLKASIYTTHDKKGSGFAGTIGQIKGSSTESISAGKTHIGNKIECSGSFRGMNLVIPGCFVGLDTAGSYTLKINSNDPDFTEITKTVTTTANTFKKNAFAEAVTLPLYTNYDLTGPNMYGLEYYLTIERSGAKPLLSNITCCGQKRVWEQWFELEGIKAEDEFALNADESSTTCGLVLDCYLQCEDLAWVCDLDILNGYDVQSVIARTIQFRAGAVAIAKLVDDDVVNLCTLYNLEQLQARRNFLNTRYTENIAWIAAHVPTGASDCFTCKKENTIISRSQLV